MATSRGYLGKNTWPTGSRGHGDASSAIGGRGKSKSPGPQFNDDENGAQNSVHGAGAARVSGRGSVQGATTDTSRGGRGARRGSGPNGSRGRGAGHPNDRGANAAFLKGHDSPGSSDIETWRLTENADRPEYLAKMSQKRTELEKRHDREIEQAVADGKMLKHGAQTTLDKAIAMVGECEEMCPERERVMRIATQFLDPLEKSKLANGAWVPDEKRMVKRFQRPDAGQPQPPPSEYRTPQTLRQTLNYLWAMLDDRDKLTRKMHEFVSDRARGIRMDFRIQTPSDPEGARLCIECHEEILRFHIFSHHYFSDPQHDPHRAFEHKPEMDQLVATLAELTSYYMQHQAVYRSPNEAEFKAYAIVFAWNNPRQRIELEAAKWPQEVLESRAVQTAFKIHEAANNIDQLLGPANFGYEEQAVVQGNFAKVFRLLGQKDVSYLMACLAEFQFNGIRHQALSAIWKAYWRTPKEKTPFSQRPQIPVTTIVTMLGLDSEEEAVNFCQLHGLTFEEGFLQVTSANKKVLQKPTMPPAFSRTIVEKKRRGRVPSAVLRGFTPAEATTSGLIEPGYQRDSPRPSNTTPPVPTAKSNPFAPAVPTAFNNAPRPDATTKPNPFAPEVSKSFKQPVGINGELSVTNDALSKSLSSTEPSKPSVFTISSSGANPFSLPSSGGAVNPFGFPSNNGAAPGMSKTVPNDASQQSSQKTSPFGGLPSKSWAQPTSVPQSKQSEKSNPFQQHPNPFQPKQPVPSLLSPSPAQNTSFVQHAAATSRSQSNEPSFASWTQGPAPSGQLPLPASSSISTPNPAVPNRDNEPSLFVPDDGSESPPVPAEAPSFFSLPPAPSRLQPTSQDLPSAQPNTTSTSTFSIPAASSPIPLSGTPARKELFTPFPNQIGITPAAPTLEPAPSVSNAALSSSKAPQAGAGANPFKSSKVPESISRAAAPVSSGLSSLLAPRTGASSPLASTTPISSTSTASPLTKASRADSQRPAPVEVPSVPPAPPKPSKKEQLGKLADLLLLETEGMIHQFLEHEIGCTINYCMKKVQREREKKAIADARRFLLSRKYIRRWKDFAWKGTLRRRAKKRRAEFAQSMRALGSSSQEKNPFSTSLNAHFGRSNGLVKPSSDSTMQPPPKPIGKHQHRASLPADSKLQQSSLPSATNDMELNKLQRKSSLGPQRSVTASHTDGSQRGLLRPRASTESIAEEHLLATERLMRQASRMIKGRTDTTHSDYFKLKALGIDPSTSLIPQTRKRTLEDTVEEVARKSRVSPAKAITDFPNTSTHAFTPRVSATSNEVSASQIADTASRHSALVANDKQHDADDQFFAEIESMKQRMADDTAWFRDLREQSERGSVERASETPKQRKLREWKPGMNRTEARWQRDGLPSFLRAPWTPRETVSRSTSRVTDGQPVSRPVINGKHPKSDRGEEEYYEEQDEGDGSEDEDEDDGQHADGAGYYGAEGDYYEDEEDVEEEEEEEEYEEGYDDEDDGIIDTQALLSANTASAFAAKGASADDAIEL